MWGSFCTNSSHAAVQVGTTRRRPTSQGQKCRLRERQDGRNGNGTSVMGAGHHGELTLGGVTEWQTEPASSTPRNQENLSSWQAEPSVQYADSSDSTAGHVGDNYVTARSRTYTTPAGTSTNSYYPQGNEDLYSAETPAESSSSGFYNSGYTSHTGYTGHSNAPSSSIYTTSTSTSGAYTNYVGSQVDSHYVNSASNVDTLTQDFGGLGVASTSTFDPINENQAYDPQAAGPSIPTRNIKAQPHRSAAEKLDPRYKVISSKDSRRFWKVGRVFMMLWTEPAGYKGVVRGGTRGNSHISGTWLNEQAYSEIRRFVVVKDNHGSCQCLAIHTYGGLATLKSNLPERDSHAVIYTSKYPPEIFSIKGDDGNIIYEQLTKDPIKVNSERKDTEGKLKAESRINYSKIYCVEKDCRVLNIGMVAPSSMLALELDSPLKPQRSLKGDPRGESDQTYGY